MFGLALQTLKFRIGSFVASFVALFFGATILMACGSLMETGIRSVVPPQRLAAAPVVVSGKQTFQRDTLPERARLDASLADRLRAVPGVDRVLTDVSFPVTALKGGHPAPNGTGLTGHGWSSAELTGAPLADGAAPSGRGEAALDQALAGRLGVRTGDRITLGVAGTGEDVTVTGLVRPHEGTDASLYFADGEAGRLLGRPGRADAIGVLPKAGVPTAELAGKIEQELKGTGAQVLTGDARGAAEFPQALEASTRLISMSAVFGGIAVMVAVFVVGSTLALLVQQRLREMALLRAIGALPTQIRRMIVGETLVVGSAAILAGLVPGWLAGRWMLGRLADGGVVAPEIVYRAGWIPMLVAAGAALASAVAAAFIASRRAALARPADALAESAVQTRWLSGPRLFFALLCFAGGAALALVTALVMRGSIAAATAGPSAMLWAGGMALISPGLTRVLTAVLRWPLRALSGFPGRLATDNARVRRIRVAGAVTPVMLVTGLATGLIYLQTAQAEASRDAASSLVRADAVVSSAAGGMEPGQVERIAALPGVAGASAYIPGKAYILEPSGDPDDEPDEIELPVQGVSAAGAAATLSAPAREGSYADLTGNTLALPTTLTGEKGRRVGDTVTVVLGDGTALPLKIVASYEGKPGFETGLLPAELVLAHSDTGLVPQILVAAKDGVPAAALVDTLRGAADATPAVRVADRATVEAAAQDSQTSAWINYLLAGTIIGYAVISLINTLVVSAAERRREFALQRLVGATEGQVLRMMTVESLLVALAGIALGTAVALATLAPMGIALGTGWLPSGPVWIYFAVVGFAAVMTLAATLVPSRMALRQRPAEVIAVA
ncbi:FtsX-like permease family protein [Streptomyces sp. NPDC085524]|uniref:FtsX-like permease family protein n=1 Tax=Streptomyces sp. NPDC085524 TaxID=3365728 RepID=UPI0037D56908